MIITLLERTMYGTGNRFTWKSSAGYRRVFFIAHVAIHSDIQRVTPNEIRGSVFASSPTLLVPVGLISILVATPLADAVGVQWIFLFTGLLALLTLPLPGSAERIFHRELPPDRELHPVSR